MSSSVPDSVADPVSSADSEAEHSPLLEPESDPPLGSATASPITKSPRTLLSLDLPGIGAAFRSHLPSLDWFHYFLNPFNSSRFLLGFLLTCLVLFGTANKVLFKIMLIPMQQYVSFLVVLNSFIYVPFFLVLVLGRLVFLPSHRFPITQWLVPQKNYIAIGFLDLLVVSMRLFSATHIGGPNIVLLSQSSIPFTMLCSRFLLHAKFQARQYAGVVLILCGIVVSLLPQYINSPAANSATNNQTFWLFIFFLSGLPYAFCHVLREKLLHNKELVVDPYFLNFLSAVYQFLMSTVLVFPLSYFLGGLSLSAVWPKLVQGLNCYTIGSELLNDPDSTGIDAMCDYASGLVNSFLAVNLIYHLALLLVVKFGSAALVTVSSALIIPLANVAFTLGMFMPTGNQMNLAHPLTKSDLIALAVILSGIVIYGSVASLNFEAIPGLVSNMALTVAAPIVKPIKLVHRVAVTPIIRGVKRGVRSTMNYGSSAASTVKHSAGNIGRKVKQSFQSSQRNAEVKASHENDVEAEAENAQSSSDSGAHV